MNTKQNDYYKNVIPVASKLILPETKKQYLSRLKIQNIKDALRNKITDIRIKGLIKRGIKNIHILTRAQKQDIKNNTNK